MDTELNYSALQQSTPTIHGLLGSKAQAYAKAHNLRFSVIFPDGYTESAHPYANNQDKTWTVNVPGAEFLKVTFSADTSFYEDDDYLTITDAQDLPMSYRSDMLAGKSVYLMGDTFTLRLVTDSSNNDYGFAIEDVTIIKEAEYQRGIAEWETRELHDGTLEITKYTGIETELVIPA